MENNRLGCINRDKNSTFNMKKIFDHYIKTGQRLQNYQRCSTAVKSRQWHPALDRIYSIEVHTLLNFIMLIKVGVLNVQRCNISNSCVNNILSIIIILYNIN